jgi:hypothetical protein
MRSGDLSALCFYLGIPDMPVNDWSRIFDGAVHDFHLAWIDELRNALNSGCFCPIFTRLPSKLQPLLFLMC